MVSFVIAIETDDLLRSLQDRSEVLVKFLPVAGVGSLQARLWSKRRCFVFSFQDFFSEVSALSERKECECEYFGP